MITAKKSLGQNFITDPSLLAKIAGFLTNPETKTVIEIGSGPTTLTRAILARQPKKMIAIEKDSRTQNSLDELKTEFPNFSYLLTDATKLDIRTLEDTKNTLLIGNLPYNVSTVLLTQWLKQKTPFQQAILMFQKEVGDRITAKPNTKDYGRLSVLSQSICTIKKLIVLPPSAFKPAPKIYSVLLEFLPKNNLTESEIKNLDILSTKAFSNRRKKVINNVENLFENTPDIFKKFSINENARAEDLTIETFIELSKEMKK